MKNLYGLATILICSILMSADIYAQSTDSLTVFVRDQKDESPIEGAEVSAYDLQGNLLATTRSNANGYAGFSFEVPASVATSTSYLTTLSDPRPNPFTDHTSIPVSLKRTATVRGEVIDLLGRSVLSVERLLGAGEHSFEVDLSGLPSGNYFFRAAANGESVGSVMLHQIGTTEGGRSSLQIVSGVGGSPVADKVSLTTQILLMVTKDDYETISNLVTIDGRSAQYVLLKGITFVAEFGKGNTPTYTVVGNATHGLDVPRDLEFNPARPWELWVVNRAFDGTVTFSWPGTEGMVNRRIEDIYGFHFMEEVSSIAFSETGLFGTAQESANTYNNSSAANYFMGPALWTSDTTIYSKHDLAGWGDLGSHLDMLHESPYGMGIAHDHDNVYWYFDGFYGNIVRYDFQQDHGPGNDDHSDGIVRRYMDARVSRVANIPGHLVLDKSTGWLYIADPGGRRITRLNTKSGSFMSDGNVDDSQMEYLDEYSRYSGATYEVFANRNLRRPSGIALHDGRLFVSDNETGEIIAYSLDGTELGRIKTPAESIMGIEVSPDGQLWYVDAEANQLVRIDPGA